MKNELGSTRLHISKQNLKFSSAHFLIFDDQNAEMLHGHNYQVKVDLEVMTDSDRGLSVDFHEIKKIVKKICDTWDEKVLLPEEQKEMKVSAHAKYDSWEVRFRDRYYAFPKKEVVLLPIVNTSVELLSEHFAGILSLEIRKSDFVHLIRRVRVSIEETRGQGASSVMKI